MKNHLLPTVAFLGFIAASVLLPVSAAAASIVLSVAGMISIVSADYGRALEPVRFETPAIPFPSPGRPQAEMREAA